MGWGKKILIVYLLFVIGIAFLVIKSMNQSQDLVTEDYYEKELIYQQQLDGQKRADEMINPVELKYSDGFIQVTFSDMFVAGNLEGKVWIYCPNNAKNDLVSRFSLPAGKTSVQIPYPTDGYRSIKIDWIAGGKNFYKELDLFINK